MVLRAQGLAKRLGASRTRVADELAPVLRSAGEPLSDPGETNDFAKALTASAPRKLCCSARRRTALRNSIARSLTAWDSTDRAELSQALSCSLLERAIGVIYRPETELQSHYFESVLSEQFDAFVWFEETNAVTALPTCARRAFRTPILSDSDMAADDRIYLDGLHDTIAVEIGSLRLQALLGAPDEAHGLIIFAHGSGSGRLSPRNNYVAARLRAEGLATLLLDLLTPIEEQDRRNVFDIALLAQRLALAAEWAAVDMRTRDLPVGYFGASTGAGAALVAAALPDAHVRAVVSRGGRPDLAGATLANVRAPTLLIVGGLDTSVIEMNRSALEHIGAPRELVIVPGATHLFEEPGTLDEVAAHAARWFNVHLRESADAA